MSGIHRIYDLLTDDDDGRLCDDIRDDACRETPRSFVLILASYCLTKLGDAIANPKTTLAWLTPMLGAPVWVIGLLVPIRESGAMIPQLALGAYIRRLPVRKWVWVVGSIGQGACIAGLGFVALNLRGDRAGWALLSLVTLFSLCRALASIAAKDVLGKTIPKRKRGQLNGWSASASGLLVILIGVSLIGLTQADFTAATLAILLFGAGLLWLAAAMLYAGVREHPGETDGGRHLGDMIRRLGLLATDSPFRLFVITRALLMCSALSAPFYVALAQQNFGGTPALLGSFIIASGIASLVSGPVWGRYADRSSKRVMIIAASVTATVGLTTAAVVTQYSDAGTLAWFLPIAYFVLSLAHSGVRVGRKTYVVNLGDGNQRTDYVAISNSVIGILLLLVGSVGALVPVIGNAGVIALLALMGTAGALLGTRLNDT